MPTPKRCPKCKSTDIVQFIGSFDMSLDEHKESERLVDNPNRPFAAFECWKCGWRKDNPAYVKYLLSRMRK